MCGNDAATALYQSIGVWLFTARLWAVRAATGEQMAYGSGLARAAGTGLGVVAVGAPANAQSSMARLRSIVPMFNRVTATGYL